MTLNSGRARTQDSQLCVKEGGKGGKATCAATLLLDELGMKTGGGYDLDSAKRDPSNMYASFTQTQNNKKTTLLSVNDKHK